MPDDDIVTDLRIDMAELRKDVAHVSKTLDQVKRELSQCMVGQEERIRTLEQTRPTWSDHAILANRISMIQSESDQRKTLDKILMVALTAGVSTVVSWVVSLRGS